MWAEKREQMAAARCTLGFITVISQNNKDSSPKACCVLCHISATEDALKERPNLIKHSRRRPVRYQKKKDPCCASLKRGRLWRALLCLHTAAQKVFLSTCRVCEANTEEEEMSDSTAGPLVSIATATRSRGTRMWHPRAAGSRWQSVLFQWERK